MSIKSQLERTRKAEGAREHENKLRRLEKENAALVEKVERLGNALEGEQSAHKLSIDSFHKIRERDWETSASDKALSSISSNVEWRKEATTRAETAEAELTEREKVIEGVEKYTASLFNASLNICPNCKIIQMTYFLMASRYFFSILAATDHRFPILIFPT